MAQHSLLWSLALLAAAACSILSAAVDMCVGETHFSARALILRSVAVTFAINWACVAVQSRGLIGPQGILPLALTLRDLKANHEFRDRKGLKTPRSSRAMARLTLWTWRAIGEANVRSTAWCCCGLSLLVAAWPSALGFALLYLTWYVYKRALNAFANLQWDSLLLEAGMLCTLLAAARSATACTAAVHLVRSCVLRLHCGAGVAKLTSGDPRWAALTALAVHHETQPLPTPLAPWLHRLPMWAHRLATLAGLAIEIVTIVGVLPAPFIGEATFAAVVATQASIVMSGSFGYFNYLSIFLAFALLGDRSLLLPRLWWTPPTSSSTLGTACVLIAVVPCTALYITRAAQYSEGRCRWFEKLDPWLRTAEHTFHVANRFSLFSNMTPQRHELSIELSYDGATWCELECRYKVGDVRRLKLVPPMHMPRLDWRLWLLAQGGRGAPWFDALLRRLLEGSHDVLALLEPLATPAKPVAARARLWVYRYGQGEGEPRWVRQPPEKRDEMFGDVVW
eukprot:CAMPEP_0119359590 /NCGR_PEP_ID=MMETSP1334-20130426/7445_1 /TAXON_ID=127549 /ORGANISM="Calcidiscus leptoporus, Strain RCC1130" /LENGTH=508 /DNA_ID=CAMNT_0007374291 /DNA_START=41 /DNA_END=1564 /DNA_ORIENTATION=-